MNDLLDSLKNEIEDINQTMRKDLAGVRNQRLAEILAHALLAGGKRVRPLLTVLAGRLCGAADQHRLAMVAISTEYIHAASLLHDDVIDRSEQRRGQPTANRLWGNDQAILAGDFLHARAMFLAGSNGGVACLESLGRAVQSMIEAEFLQMLNAGAMITEENAYFRVLTGKTAALTAAACEMGAVVAGTAAEKRATLFSYGTNLGLAFQLVDDLLDYQGNPGRTGKQRGNDFQEGKITLPLIHALKRARPADREFLLDLLGAEPEKRRAGFAEAAELIRVNGGFDHARERAAALIEKAIDNLAGLPELPERATLTGLARYVLQRDR